MAVDTPARIAILGAGPIGVETALYARFLGYDVDLYERQEVAANLLRWGHVRMFSPFSWNSSPLGLAALAAQDESYRPPNADELLTGREWATRYVRPLAETDLLVDFIHPHTEVLAISKGGLLKTEFVGGSEREEAFFRLLLRKDGQESYAAADVVIDCTGVYGNHNWAGDGGMPAPGEKEAGARESDGQIEYGIPDVSGHERTKYATGHTLLIGDGYSAATTAVAFRELLESSPRASLTWLTRCAPSDDPLPRIAADALIERDRLCAEANRMAKHAPERCRYLAGASLMRIERQPRVEEESNRTASNALLVTVQRHADGEEEQFAVDRIVANVGYRPDLQMLSELQVHWCYASDGPMKLAAALMGSSGDCTRQASTGAASLMNPEPHFYVLGSKSYGRKSNFLFRSGLQQIRDLFTIIGDREALDLYAGTRQLPR